MLMMFSALHCGKFWVPIWQRSTKAVNINVKLAQQTKPKSSSKQNLTKGLLASREMFDIFPSQLLHVSYSFQ